MKKLSKKEKFNIFTAGVGAYTVSSIIAYFKHHGIEFFNQSGQWVIKIHKTMGVIDVFRTHGALAKMDVFGSDGIFFLVGMFSGIVAVIIMKGWYYIQSMDKDTEPKIKTTKKGYKVKINR
ncbi:MAG TPA: hypothetical protein VK190_04750 [Pseudoneobacillus sp.]|nr:hypothetical protein [Pseudoneobacillus sp.]